MTSQRTGRGRHGGDTDRSMLGYGDRCAVQLPRHVDSRSGQECTVRRTTLRGADIWVTVEFGDGTREEYIDNELRRL